MVKGKEDRSSLKWKALIKVCFPAYEVLCVPYSEIMSHLNLDSIHKGDVCCSSPRRTQKLHTDKCLIPGVSALPVSAQTPYIRSSHHPTEAKTLQ